MSEAGQNERLLSFLNVIVASLDTVIVLGENPLLVYVMVIVEKVCEGVLFSRGVGLVGVEGDWILNSVDPAMTTASTIIAPVKKILFISPLYHSFDEILERLSLSAEEE